MKYDLKAFIARVTRNKMGKMKAELRKQGYTMVFIPKSAMGAGFLDHFRGRSLQKESKSYSISCHFDGSGCMLTVIGPELYTK